MAARRSSSSRSRSSNRRPSRAAQTNNNVPIIIGTGVVVVVILIAIVMNTGDDKPAPSPKTEVVEKNDQPEKKAATPEKKVSGKNLKDPDRAAPELTQSVLTEADTLYKKAKKLNEDARRAQNAGEDGKFNQLINDSWDTMMKLDSFIETYTDWLEEADMEDWRVPSSYRTLQSRMSTWDGLKGRVKRIKPNRR